MLDIALILSFRLGVGIMLDYKIHFYINFSLPSVRTKITCYDKAKHKDPR